MAAVLSAGAQPSGSGAISGRVVLQASGEAVRKAVVTLVWRGTPRSWAAAMTDGAGSFSFDALPPGVYELRAEREGWGAATYGAADPGQMGEFISLRDREHRDGLVLRLVQPASISGTVLDGDGEPLAGAEVRLLAEGYPRGVRELMERGAAETNDRGEYRLRNVAPGRYYVAAGHSATRIFAQAGGAAEVYPRQFYGGTAEWKSASPLAVGPGQQARGIDFRLSAARAVPIRGRVNGVPESGGQPRFVQVELVAIGEGGAPSGSFGSGTGPPDYRFQIPDVLPGRYQLTASMQAGNQSFYATQKLEVREDPGELVLGLAPATDLRGEVRVEGAGAGKGFQVTLTRGDLRGQAAAITARTAADGSFTLAQVPPGVWDIGVAPLPKGGYLKAMQLGEQDVLTGDMEIGPGTDARLHIVISPRGATVRGEVAPAGRKPALVLLAPAGRYRSVISFFETATTDADGKFELTGITPGRYRIFGFEAEPAGGVRNPDLADRLAQWGEPVEAGEGAVIEARPRVIPAAALREALP